jgi:hypothetical protein
LPADFHELILPDLPLGGETKLAPLSESTSQFSKARDEELSLGRDPAWLGAAGSSWSKVGKGVGEGGASSAMATLVGAGVGAGSGR